MRHRRLIFAALLLAIIGSATIWTLSSFAQQTTGIVTQNINTGLRLRQAPVDGAILTSLNPGTPLTIIGQNADGSWLQIRTDNGLTGWVSAQYIERQVGNLPIVGQEGNNVQAIAGDPVLDPTQVNAQIIPSIGMLNIRSAPGTETDIVAQLPGGTQVVVFGRVSDNSWLKIRAAGGVEGWVVNSYIQVQTDLNQIENAASAIVPIDFSGVISNITPRATEIYRYGRSLGNRPDVFSKIGDSITVSQYTLHPIGWGNYNLGGYSHLQPVVNYYRSTIARDANSFSNTSLSAVTGWTTVHALEPTNAQSGVCLRGETPVACEFRVVRPAVAIIMYGTNDSGYIDMGVYQANLAAIVQTAIDHGVIPVLSTIPNRLNAQANSDAVNRIIWDTARTYSIPIIDYQSALQSLPNTGLSGDGVHPSEPPGGYVSAAFFTEENLQYGYTVRNVTTLYALDAIWRQIIIPG